MKTTKNKPKNRDPIAVESQTNPSDHTRRESGFAFPVSHTTAQVSTVENSTAISAKTGGLTFTFLAGIGAWVPDSNKRHLNLNRELVKALVLPTVAVSMREWVRAILSESFPAAEQH